MVELKRERRYVVLLTESLCLNGTQERTLLWITIQCKDELTSNIVSITSLTSSTHLYRTFIYIEVGDKSDMCFSVYSYMDKHQIQLFGRGHIGGIDIKVHSCDSANSMLMLKVLRVNLCFHM